MNLLSKEARQSRVRVRSGLRLVGALVAAARASLAFEVSWLARVLGAAGAFFAVITVVEYFNVRRWERSIESAA